MRKLTILILALFLGSTTLVTAAEDQNSSRSNEGQATAAPAPAPAPVPAAAPANHNSTRPNRTAASHDDSESASDMMDEGAATHDAASGLPTGKRQHKPLN